jgi:hypothetical protein
MYGMSVRERLGRGNFPEPALRMPGTSRRRWFAGYVEQMITRDVPGVAPRRDPELLRRYMSALPAWFFNRIKRLVKTPKRYLIDPALVAAVLGLGRDAILHGPDMLGRLIETAAGTLIGIEVKASATVTTSDARHLAWLRDEVGDAFLAGIVVRTGPHVFPLGDRLIAAPVSALWS